MRALVGLQATNSSWHRGFCAYTDSQAASAVCGTPGVAKGSWRLARAEQCVGRCEACSACVYISFDPADRDCSWFTTCEVSHLKRLRSNWHHTLVVRRGTAIVTPGQLPQLPPIPSNLPEDGTQGYSPYFYKMDEPVRVRRTISYGRGWQLLRSRGAGNEDDGPSQGSTPELPSTHSEAPSSRLSVLPSPSSRAHASPAARSTWGGAQTRLCADGRSDGGSRRGVGSGGRGVGRGGVRDASHVVASSKYYYQVPSRSY